MIGDPLPDNTTEPEAPSVGLQRADDVSSIEVTAQLAKTKAAAESYSSETTPASTGAYYSGLAELGSLSAKATLNGDDVDGIRTELDSVLKDVASNDTFMSTIKTVGPKWIERAKGTDKGVALSVTCYDVQQVGDMHEVTYKSGDSKHRILGTSKVFETLSPGSRILVLGEIVHAPADRIDGYEGADETVVWSDSVLLVGE